MKKCAAVAYCFLCFLLSARTAVSRDKTCFKYEPVIVELTGTVKRVVFPGRPNYESIKDGDEPEPYWVLFLSIGICVDGDPRSEIYGAEENVTRLQLNMDSSFYENYRAFLEKTVTIRGTLTHAITGHHHTEVLINVIEMKTPTPGLQADAPQSPRR